jgi:hypothetical protein
MKEMIACKEKTVKMVTALKIGGSSNKQSNKVWLSNSKWKDSGIN